MSLGRLTAAAVSGNIDNTLALASLNFDFSLVKVEAPSEYKPLGLSLSARRSEEAESGATHITARKLGALFQDIIPSVPNLFRTYGIRASEIARSPKVNPKGTRKDGMFADQVGADGTSIWAAATSGDSAIAVHLLACMLARIWSGPEATSIWVELVDTRRRALSAFDERDALNISSLAASRISLSREQLAKWDASARAWLLTADEARELSQKQLMLIINNITTPVNNNSTTYESVVDAWKTAMTTMEKLIAGIPQSVHTGASLLGLASWHLYPDIVVLGNRTKEVRQKDKLIEPGGLVTVGLQDLKSDMNGVFWSLPLAHIRYYGDAVSATTSIASNTSRVSVNQLLQVALGSLFRSWTVKPAEFSLAAEVLRLMWYNISKTYVASKLCSSWLCVLADAAGAFLNSTGLEKTECLQLLKTGRRRYASFFTECGNLKPIFGLSECKMFLKILKGDDERIQLLRDIALSVGGSGDSMIIRYRHTFSIGHSAFECATVQPIKLFNRGTKRNWNGVESVADTHVRWIEYQDITGARGRKDQLLSTGEAIIFQPAESLSSSTVTDTSFCWVDAPTQFVQNQFETSCGHSQTVQFQFLFGDPDIAALYTLHDLESQPDNVFTLQHVKGSLVQEKIFPEALLSHLSSLGQSDVVEDTVIPLVGSAYGGVSSRFQPLNSNSEARQALTGLLSRSPRPHVLPCISSLKALATVVEIYKSLPGATVALRIACRPLYKSKWIPLLHHEAPVELLSQRLSRNFEPYGLNRAQTFACIAMFESGFFNLYPDSLKAVMALSSGNSIYVATPLLSDPWTNYPSDKVSRIIGNVGRPGITMLIPPQNPRIQSLDHNWKVINHHEFKGIREDCFPHTTLHLSFSGWEMAVDVGTLGAQDHEALFLEAPISVHERGEWVADLDLLRILLSPKVKRIDGPQCSGNHGTDDEPFPFEMVSIDSWEELLESPLETGIVRAYGNWQARLAATALSVQRGHEVRVLPEELCWKCCVQQRTIGTSQQEKDKSPFHAEACSESGSNMTDDDAQDEDDRIDEAYEVEPPSDSTTVYIM